MENGTGLIDARGVDTRSPGVLVRVGGTTGAPPRARVAAPIAMVNRAVSPVDLGPFTVRQGAGEEGSRFRAKSGGQCAHKKPLLLDSVGGPRRA